MTTTSRKLIVVKMNISIYNVGGVCMDSTAIICY